MTAPRSTPPRPDLAAIRAEELGVCGSCDAGLTVACTCSTADPRSVIADLLDYAAWCEGEIERLTAAVERVEARIGDCAGHRDLSLEITRCPWCMIRAALTPDGGQ